MTNHDTFSGNETGGNRGLVPGTRLGIYELREPLGQGGMGQVWQAFDTQGDRLVALKLLPPEFRGNSEAIAQVREAFRVIHALTHQYIGKTNGLFNDEVYGPYIVMDYLPGVSLSHYARSYRKQHGTFSIPHVVELLRPVAEALDFAHSKSVLHRDIKPENILIEVKNGKPGDVWLIDFGLAAEIHSSMSRYTQGKVDTRGTRPYQSPEQLRGKKALWDSRTDQYSLAIVAYELLAGHLPFEGDDFVLMNAILNETPEPITGLNEVANRALLKALSKEREARYADCSSFLRALIEEPVQPRVESERKPAPVVPPPIPAKPVATTPVEPVRVTSKENRPVESQSAAPAPVPVPEVSLPTSQKGKFGHLLKAVNGLTYWMGFEPTKGDSVTLIHVVKFMDAEEKRWTVPLLSIDKLAIYRFPAAQFYYVDNIVLRILFFLPMLWLILPLHLLIALFGRGYAFECRYHQRVEGLIEEPLRIYFVCLKYSECQALMKYFVKEAKKRGIDLEQTVVPA